MGPPACAFKSAARPSQNWAALNTALIEVDNMSTPPRPTTRPHHARRHLAHHALAHPVTHHGHLLLALLGVYRASAKSKGTHQRH